MWTIGETSFDLLQLFVCALPGQPRNTSAAGVPRGPTGNGKQTESRRQLRCQENEKVAPEPGPKQRATRAQPERRLGARRALRLSSRCPLAACRLVLEDVHDGGAGGGTPAPRTPPPSQ